MPIRKRRDLYAYIRLLEIAHRLVFDGLPLEGGIWFFLPLRHLRCSYMTIGRTRNLLYLILYSHSFHIIPIAILLPCILYLLILHPLL